MNIFFLRHYIEICHIIINEKTDLAQFLSFFSLSQYEFVSDLQHIQEMQGLYGIKIFYKLDQLYFEIADQDLFNRKFRYLRAFYYRHRYTFRQNKDILIQAFISKSLLWSKDHISVDDLAEEIGYSRSNIRSAVKSGREFIYSYDIKVENVPYYGLTVKGNEFDIRRCLIALYSLFDINVIACEDDVNIMRGYQSGIYEAAVSIVEHCLMDHSYRIANIEKRRLINYLIIQNARIQAGFKVSLERSENSFLIRVKENTGFAIACAITEQLRRDLSFGPYNDDEILSCAILLEIANPHYEQMINAACKSEEQLFNVLNDQILLYFEQEFSVQLRKDPYFTKLLSHAVSVIAAKRKCNMLMNRSANLGGTLTLTAESPILSKVRADITSRLEEILHETVSFSHIDPITEIFFYYIQLSSIRFRKLRIAIISRNSVNEPYLIKKLIEKEVDPNYYSVLDCLWYNEVLSESNSDYDLIISDTVTQNFGSKVLPYTEARFRLNNLNDFIRNNRDLCCGVLDQVLSLEVDLNERSSIDSLFLMIHQNLDLSISLIREQFTDSKIFNHCLVTIINSRAVNQNLLITGMFKKKITRNGTKCDSYLFLTARIDQTNIRFYNVLLYELTADPAFLRELIQSPNLTVINNRMNKILR